MSHNLPPVTGAGGMSPEQEDAVDSIVNLPDDSVPKALSGELTVSGTTVDPTTEKFEFTESIIIPQASVELGEITTLSEGGSFLFLTAENSGNSFVAIDSRTETTGSTVPRYLRLASQTNQVIQGTDTTVITANPLNWSVTTALTAQTNELVFKANGAMTNVRARIVDNASGVVIKYIPSKKAWDSGTDGVNMIAGNNTFSFFSTAADSAGVFNLGITPFRFQPSVQLDVTLQGDSVDLLGNASNEPYLEANLQLGVFDNVITLQDDSNTSFDNHVAVFDGTGADTVKQSEDVIIRATGATTNPTFIFQDFLGNSELAFSADLNTANNGIVSNNPLTIETQLGNDLKLTTALGNVVLETDAVNNKVRILKSGESDVSDVLSIEQSGSNPGVSDWHVGNRSPEGNITANGGAFYIRDDGVNSNLYLKRSDGSNTGWNEIGAGGDVDGPTSSINNHIVTFDGATGKLIKQGEDTVIRAESATGNPQVVFQNSVGTDNLALAVNFLSSSAGLGSSLPFTLETFGSNDLTLKTADGNVDVDLETASTEFSVAGTLHTDTNAIATFSTSSTNGGTTSIHVGDRNPEGNVTANGGALYIRDDGVNSDLYIKKSDASNTGWSDITSDGDVTGPASSVDNTLAMFDGTTGKIIDQAVDVLYSSSATTRNVKIDSPSGTGIVGWELHNSSNVKRGELTYTESADALSLVQRGNGPFTIESLGTGSIVIATINSITLDAGAANWVFDDDSLETTASGAAVTSEINFKNSGGTTTGTFDTNHNLSQVRMLAPTSYAIELNCTDSNVRLITQGATNRLVVDNGGAPDTSPHMQLVQGGTNGGNVQVFVGDRSPEGNVTGNGGDLYIEDSATDPNLFIKTGDASNTGWNKFVSQAVLDQTISVMQRPIIASSSAQAIAVTPQTINGFITTAGDIDTNTTLLEGDQTNNRFDVKQITDTTNGDLYRVHFSATYRAPAGLRLDFDIVTLTGGAPGLTSLSMRNASKATNQDNTVSISGIIRGPSTLSGVTGIQVQFAGSATGSVNWDALTMTVERIT